MLYNPQELEQGRIVVYPDPRLRDIAKPIKEITPEIVNLAERMIDIMVKSQGIGLAGPQIAVGLRIIVVSVTGKKQDAQVIVNPELSNFSGHAEIEEGCLSIPNVHAKVRRSACCTLKGQDLEGNSITTEATDMAAIVFQHEVDHLDGRLFIDRLTKLSRIACRKSIRQLELDYENRK